MKTHVDKHAKQLLEEAGTKSLSWSLAGSSSSVHGIVALSAEVSSVPGGQRRRGRMREAHSLACPVARWLAAVCKRQPAPACPPHGPVVLPAGVMRRPQPGRPVTSLKSPGGAAVAPALGGPASRAWSPGEVARGVQAGAPPGEELGGGVLAGNALFYFRSPFPPGDRVTFNGKECMCQKCSLPKSAGSSVPLCQGLWSKWVRQGWGGGLCGAGRGLTTLGAKAEAVGTDNCR